MRTLAIECATEACSVALFEAGALLAHDHRVLGRGHAEHLVPMIAALPDKGKAQLIKVSLGPGSFTGVRIGIATARALAYAWQAQVLGYPTLALVAAMARHQLGSQPVTAAMTAGHGQWFIQNFDETGTALDAAASLVPAEAVIAAQHALVAGTQAEALVALRGAGSPFTCHPDARMVADMPEAIFTTSVTPVYGRAPDAKLPT